MAAVGMDVGEAIDVESLEMGLPITNEENKKLEAEVQRKEREISALQRQAENIHDRVQAMGDHLKNVQQELQQTQVQYHSSITLCNRLIVSEVATCVHYRAFMKQERKT